MAKIVFESKEPITFKKEDSGCALIINTGGPEPVDEDSTMVIEIRSYDVWAKEYPDSSHIDMKKLSGRKIRVTIEEI